MQRIALLLLSLLCVSCEGPDRLYLSMGDTFIPDGEVVGLCAESEHRLSLEFGAAGSIGGGTMPFVLRSFAEVSESIELTADSSGVQDIHRLTLRAGEPGSAQLHFLAESRAEGIETSRLERRVDIIVRDCE